MITVINVILWALCTVFSSVMMVTGVKSVMVGIRSGFLLFLVGLIMFLGCIAHPISLL